MLRVLTLLTMTLCGCAAREPARQTTVFPRFTLYPTQKNLPAALIADLPKRIQGLPAGAISISSLVGKLGLSDYRSNVSSNLRWNTFFVYLDTDHILYMVVDVTSIPKDWQPFATPWATLVTSCQLRRNPDQTIAERVLAPTP